MPSDFIWYYLVDEQQRGPLSTEEMQALLTQHAIDAKTLVWTEEMPDWQPLSQTDLAGHHPLRNLFRRGFHRRTDSAGSPHGRLQRTRPYRLWRQFVINYCVGSVLIGGGTFAILLRWNLGLGILAVLFGSVAVLVSVVCKFMVIYHAWAAIQDSHPPLTPDKAVGFMLVPLFHYYWGFKAIAPLPRLLNQYCVERSIAARPIREDLGYLWCIFKVIGGTLIFLRWPAVPIIAIVELKAIAEITGTIQLAKGQA